MSRTMTLLSRIFLLFALTFGFAFDSVAANANARPEKPPNGQGRYILVLWEPGTPIPGADSKKHKKDVPEPDVEKHGGRVLRKSRNQRIINLPPAAARELRRHPSVAYLQRVWMGEADEELLEDTDTSDGGGRLRTQADSITNLSWGPKPYQYDGSGNIAAIASDNYTYDTAGRLISATVSGRTENYQYDAFGNLTEQAVAGSAPVSIPVDPSTNRLVSATYDAAGNMTSRKGEDGAYEYDSLNMLTAYRSRVMIYDANDERLGVIIDPGLSRWTVRDLQGRAIREFKGEPQFGESYWTWEQDYVHGDAGLVGGERLAFSLENQSGQTTSYGGLRHYHLDHLGSVRLVTNASKQAVSEHDYLPFGTNTTKTYQEQINWGDPHIDSMRWAGHQRDFLGFLNAENSNYLDYMHARYYDPNLGRFLSIDPVNDDIDPLKPQSWNKYAYTRSNPVHTVDPDGKAGWIVTGGGGALIGAGIQIGMNTWRGRDWDEGVVQAMVVGAAWGSGAKLVGMGINLARGGAAAATAAATEGAMVQGLYGAVAREALEAAANSGGSTVHVVTKLTQAPAVGRALSVATGDGATAVANAARQNGQLYAANIPKALIDAMKQAGLVVEKTVRMTNGSIGTELRFQKNAAEFIVKLFMEVP